eukprot:619261-Rhodomonas_salina.1
MDVTQFEDIVRNCNGWVLFPFAPCAPRTLASARRNQRQNQAESVQNQAESVQNVPGMQFLRQCLVSACTVRYRATRAVCSIRYWPRVWCYARASLRNPHKKPLCSTSCTRNAVSCVQVVPGMQLYQECVYAMSGTDLGYGATRIAPPRPFRASTIAFPSQ